LNGKYVIKAPFSNNMTMKVFALNFQGNQYKKMFEKDLGPFCDALYQEPYKAQYERFVSHTISKVPWKTCPYPAGPEEITNYMMDDVGDLLPPYIPGGEKWKAEARFYEKEIELGGYNLFAIIRNDESLLKGG
jgi:hypothetical protein